MKKIILAVLATFLISCGLFSQQAQAVLITGNITFTGSSSLDTSSASTATQVTAWHGLAPGDLPQVQSVDGDFAAFVTPGDGVTFQAPWSFNSGAIASFWSVDGFTFDLTSSSIAYQGAGSVVVNGSGFISGNGFDPTFGVWHYTTQNPSAASKFSFSAAVGTVPDGGATVCLLGIALTASEVVRRRLAASRG